MDVYLSHRSKLLAAKTKRVSPWAVSMNQEPQWRSISHEIRQDWKSAPRKPLRFQPAEDVTALVPVREVLLAEFDKPGL